MTVQVQLREYVKYIEESGNLQIVSVYTGAKTCPLFLNCPYTTIPCSVKIQLLRHNRRDPTSTYIQCSPHTKQEKHNIEAVLTPPNIIYLMGLDTGGVSKRGWFIHRKDRRQEERPSRDFEKDRVYMVCELYLLYSLYFQ